LNDAFQTHLSQCRQRIEARLRTFLEAETTCPARLREAMAYSLLAPGKRLRPLLVLLACEACGGRQEEALPAACAVEMVHAYSLVHDDLPGMDNDDLRRGQPTCHRQFDEATAILVGDGLLTLAFQLLATEIRPGELAALCCRELAQAAGVAGMVGGQMDDLQWEGQAERTLEMLISMHRRKTGALFRASLRLGGWLGTVGEPDLVRQAKLAALTDYAEQLGLAFQIADDLLDVEGQEADAGKRVHKDAARGKLTYPGLLGLAASRERLRHAGHAALEALAPLGDRAHGLAAMVRQVIDRKK
jgi:geranylgeranyl diphosphate synthase type II